MKKLYFLSIVLFVSGKLFSQQLTVTQYATGFTSPVDIKNCGDERLFIVERPGTIKIIDSAGSTLATPFLDITTIVLASTGGGERGLLGLAFSPDYKTSGYFYVNYTSQPSGHTHISRFSVDPSDSNHALASSEEMLLEIFQPFSNHNGGHLAFGSDGYLYAGMGDGGSFGDPGNRAQSLDSLLGKMLRIDVSIAPGYSVPASNPFVGISGRDEIWSYGLRNPWRFSFDKLTGDLWIGDVGQNKKEEIDFQIASSLGGENYGWRCYEGDTIYSLSAGGCPPYANTDQPAHVYSHTSGGGNCSVTGGYVYRGGEYHNNYGKYFFTDYCTPTIRSLLRDTSGNMTHTNYGSFIGNSFSTFGENMYGELFLASLAGQIYRLGDTACLPVAHFSDFDTLHICGSSADLLTPAGRNFSYSWIANGIPVPNSNFNTLHITQSGTYSVTVTNPSLCSNISGDVHVILDSVPVVSFTGLDTLYCLNHGSVSLTGSPIGGTFTGPGVTGNTFDPVAAGIGTFDISYSYTNTAGCTASSIQQTMVDACTGIQGEDLENMEIIPNPSKGIFVVRIQLVQSMEMELNIFDVLGRNVISKSIEVIPGLNSVQVNTELSNGIYSASLFTGKNILTRKIIIE